MLQLFAANGIGVAQNDTTFEIVFYLAQLGFAQRNVSLILLTVDHQLMRLAHAVGQRGFGPLKRLFGVGRIQR
ncbi:hypothetical protein D3C77_721850 [compost metagenome]